MKALKVIGTIGRFALAGALIGRHLMNKNVNKIRKTNKKSAKDSIIS